MTELEKIRREYMKNHRPKESGNFGSSCINHFVRFAENKLINKPVETK